MKIALKHRIRLDEFENYTNSQLKKRAHEDIARQLLDIMMKRYVVKQAVGSDALSTEFTYKIYTFSENDWEGIVNALRNIKEAMEKHENLETHFASLCRWLRQ